MSCAHHGICVEVSIKVPDFVMLTHPSMLGRLLFSFAVCLLLCGIVFAEIPELLSLTDNVSNDFTIRKTGRRGCTTTLGVIHKSAPRDMKNFECGPRPHCGLTFVGAETNPSELLDLHPVLRR
jgi:hypothetical protein